MSIRDLLKTPRELIENSSLSISIIDGSMVEALNDPEIYNQTSLVVLQRPKFYPLWDEPFYSYFDSFYHGVKAGDFVDNTLRLRKRRVREYQGQDIEYIPRLVGKTGYIAVNMTENMSFAVLSTFLVLTKVLSEDKFKARYRKDMDLVRRRWRLEENIDPDSYETTPYVCVMPLESYLHQQAQIEVLEEIFEGHNVQIILFNDEDYHEVCELDEPYHEEATTNFDGTFLSRFRKYKYNEYRKELLKCKNHDQAKGVIKEYFDDFNEELEIWQQYSPKELVLSDKTVQEFENEIRDRFKKVWEQVDRRLYRNNSKYRAIIRRNWDKHIKEQRIKDHKWHETLLDESVRLDFNSKDSPYSFNGFYKRIPKAVFEALSEERQQEILKGREAMRRRRNAHRESFTSYHQAYNRFKCTVMGTWEKDNKKLSHAQKRRWEEFRGEMRELKARADKQFDSRVQRIKASVYDSYTIQSLLDTPDEDILGGYVNMINPEKGMKDQWG